MAKKSRQKNLGRGSPSKGGGDCGESVSLPVTGDAWGKRIGDSGDTRKRKRGESTSSRLIAKVRYLSRANQTKNKAGEKEQGKKNKRIRIVPVGLRRDDPRDLGKACHQLFKEGSDRQGGHSQRELSHDSLGGAGAWQSRGCGGI